MRISKLYLPAAAMVGAVALAGCGGGGSEPERQQLVTGTHDCEDGSTATGMGADQAAADAAAKANCPKPEELDAKLPAGLGAQQLYNLLAGSTRDHLVTTSTVPFSVTPIVKETAEGGGQDWKKALNAAIRPGLRTGDVYVASLNGQIVEHPTNGEEATITAGAKDADRGDVKFRGITGDLFCGAAQTSACTSAASGGKTRLTGDWYFIPNTADGAKRWSAKGSGFESVGWAEYGYWLAQTGDADAWQMHRLVVRKGDTIAAGLTTGTGTATYSGDAHGVSALAPNGDTPAKHGAFDAKVNLEARFGTSPMIKGTIDGFKGDAVNTDWKLALNAGTFAGDGTVDDDGNNAGTTGGGQWTATPYGTDAGKRPTGVVGTFDGKFTDGAVAGVYHAD